MAFRLAGVQSNAVPTRAEVEETDMLSQSVAQTDRFVAKPKAEGASLSLHGGSG